MKCQEKNSIPLKARLSSYKNYVYIGILSVLLVAVFVFKLGGRKHRNERDFVAATNAFAKWEQILDKEHEALKNLAAIMKKHPELEAQYDGDLAQNFIAMQESKGAKKYGEKAIKRTNQPYFRDYALTSLLVSEKKYSEALKRAIHLKDKMLGDEIFWKKGGKAKSFGSGLFAFNLMRIATLYQEMSMSEQELDAWKELKAYAAWDTPQKDKRIEAEGFELLLNHFSVQDITLLDYISSREKELSR